MTGWILSSTILLVLVLVIRGITKRQLSATARYLLWSVVALRLLFPFFYPVDTSRIAEVPGIGWLAQLTLNWTEKTNPVAVRETLGSPEAVPEEESKSAAKEQAGRETGEEILKKEKNEKSEPDKFVLLFWLLGALLFLVRILWINIRLYGILCQKRKRLCYPKVPIPVYLVEELPTPFLFGLFHPAIYLNQFSTDSEDEAYILCHELIHYRHKDHLWAVVRALCVVLHWYHPLVWLAAFCSKRDSELACDEGTIRALGEEQAVSYGEALLRMSERMGEQRKNRREQMIISTETAFGETELKERIVRIKNRNKKSLLLGGVVFLTVLAVFLLLLAKQQTIEPLHPEEILLLEGDGFALDGVHLGDSYIRVKKRLEKTPQLQGHTRIEEYETEYLGESVVEGLIDFQCRAEIEGKYNGGVYYTFLDRRLFRGKYELIFEEHEKAVEYLKVLDRMFSGNAVLTRKVDPESEYYSYQDKWEYTKSRALEDAAFLYQYWGKDNDIIRITIRKENMMAYEGDMMWDAGAVSIVYETADWDYWAWYSGLEASFSEEDGSLERAKDSALRYEETNLRYLDKEGSEDYSLSPKCRFLVQIDTDSWAETSIEELLRYMETIPVSTKWEIGLNEQDEIEWIREKKGGRFLCRDSWSRCYPF